MVYPEHMTYKGATQSPRLFIIFTKIQILQGAGYGVLQESISRHMITLYCGSKDIKRH